MAVYHFSLKQIRRSAGQSAIASAAYRAGERLYSEYYGETSDYTRKGGVLYTEILLPPNAPEAYRDRQTLWNAVEKSEPHPRAQLAYSFDMALQNELTMQENIALVREFVKTQLVDEGMICDLAVHSPDKGDGIPNPHAHVMATMRPLNPDGTFGQKQRREYVTDEHGNRIRAPDGQYVFRAVHTTDWHTPEKLEHWRAEWARMINERFAEKGLECRVDHRSYARQGVDQVPTVHEGPRVRKMEERGLRTDKGDQNRAIRAANRLLRELQKRIDALTEWLGHRLDAPDKPQDLIELLVAYQNERQAAAWSTKGKVRNLKQFAETINYLTQNELLTMDALESRLTSVSERYSALTRGLHEKSERIHELKTLLQLAETYRSFKPVYDEMNAIHWKGKRERFAQEHERELNGFYAVRRALKERLGDQKMSVKAWREELNRLSQEYAQEAKAFAPLRDDLLKLKQVKNCIDTALRREENTRNQEKNRTELWR